MTGGQEIWSICRTLGWHPISSKRNRRGANTRASFYLIHAYYTRQWVHARTLQTGRDQDRLPGAELRGTVRRRDGRGLFW